jgi:diacylglycerol kinase (ATP)
VANSGVFGGGMALLPMAEIDDGALDILLTKRHAKWRYLRALGRVFSGTHLDPRFSTVLRGHTVEIDSSPAYDVFADGDPVGRTPARIGVHQRCLRVLVPA